MKRLILGFLVLLAFSTSAFSQGFLVAPSSATPGRCVTWADRFHPTAHSEACPTIADQSAAEAGTSTGTVYLNPLRAEQHFSAALGRSGGAVGQFFETGSGDGSETLYTSIGTGKIKRLHDRLFLGQAADASAGGSIIPNITWITDANERYLLRGASVESVPRYGGIGLLGISRASDAYWYGGVKRSLWATATVYGAGAIVGSRGNIYTTTVGGTSGVTAPTHSSGSVSDGGVTWTATASVLWTPIGVAGGVVSDIADGRGAWGYYGFVQRLTAGGTAFGFEMAVRNEGASIQSTPHTPFGANGGATIGYYAHSQGASPGSAGLLLHNSGSPLLAGIVMTDDALNRVSGIGDAMRLGENHRIAQFSEADDAMSSWITFNVDDLDDRVGIELSNDTITFKRGTNPDLAVFTTDAGASLVANAFQFNARQTTFRPTIVATGDTNIGIGIQGRGTGVSALLSGNGTQQVTWDNTGFAFAGGSPIARPDFTTPGGSATLNCSALDTTTTTATDANIRAVIACLKATIDSNISYRLYQ